MRRLQNFLPGSLRAAASRLRLLFGGGLALGDLTRVLAEAFGDRPAIASTTPTPGLPDRARTYLDLEDDVARLAAAHRASVEVRAAPVAILCANRVDVLLHALALARIGAVPLPLNHRLRGEEQAAAIAASGAVGLVADSDVAGPLLALLAPKALRVAWTGVGGPPPREGFDLPAWLLAHPGERFPGTKPAPANDGGLLLCTSGTTGLPKVARLTSRSLLGAIGRLHALPVGRQRGLRAGRDVIVGRNADRLKVGGFSVFPAEVEAELRGHPAVAELAVVGVPDPRLGERLFALVVPRAGFDSTEFLAWAAERVAPYRRPRDAVAVAALPMGKNGKLDRRGAGRLADQMLARRP